MITNDPLQAQLSMGAYSGAINPFGVPVTALQTAMNPTAFNPYSGVAQTMGISPYGPQGVQQGFGVPNPGAIAQQQQQLQQLQQIQQLQQLQQLASILASQGAVPQLFGIAPQVNPLQNQLQQNPFQQNQLQQGVLQNLLAQNPFVNPIVAQQLALQAVSQLGQPQFGQSQLGQTWPVYPQVGQIGSVFGQQTGLPYGQTPFAQAGYQLAPQSWVGQAGLFGGQQVPGQIQAHHLSQLGGRGLY